ncbi:hypothetical protein OROHE_023019 [Orobanche hederae]
MDSQQLSQSNIVDSSKSQPPSNLIGIQSQTPNFHQKALIDLINSHISSQPQHHYGPNFSYQNLLAAPSVVYVLGPSQPPKVSKKRKNTPLNSETTPGPVNRRWTLAEDIALMNARLHVSCDADIGVGKKSTTLWNRIFQVWKDNMGRFDATRDANSLENRWGRLQAAINKFHGFYELCERTVKSGHSLEDVKREICRKNEKWCTQLLTKHDGTKKKKPFVDISNENSPTSKEAQFDPSFIAGSSYAPENISTDSKMNEAENTIDEGVARPAHGRKAVKDQRKRIFAEKNVVDALGNLQTFIESQVNLNRVELERKSEKENKDYELRREIFTSEIKFKERALKRKEQERILDKDLTRLAPNVREKYEMMQAQILKEWEKDGFFGDATCKCDHIP